MQQLRAVWDGMDALRRMMAFGAAAAVFALVLVLARAASAPSMALLYAGLEGAQAGQVITALDQRGLRYEVRGDAIFVELAQRDETRMALAAQGLPANSASGYELLDGLTGFGTTSQMFDAAYWRATEGELARTIVASPHVRAARVHIAHGAGQGFRRDRSLSASVTLTPAGAAVPPAHAEALRFLIASAVAGLSPENVAVIDANSGLISGEDEHGAGAVTERAAQLRRNVERLLEAHVGPGRVVVELNLETVTDRETIRERLIDPDSRVALSTESEERSASSTDSRNPAVTVASNLPDGDAAGQNGQSETRDVQSRQRNAYEVSHTSREVQRGPGAIRRLTVAVLLDGTQGTGPDGRAEWQPRPEAELEALRELVASAVGFDESRGDVITLRSLPFEALPLVGTEVGRGLADRLGLDMMGLLRLAVLALVILILALFVLRPLLQPARSRPEAGQMALPGVAGSPATTALGGAQSAALTGEIAEAGEGPASGGEERRAPSSGISGGEADPVERMRALIAGRQDDTLQILRGWMDERREGR